MRYDLRPSDDMAFKRAGTFYIQCKLQDKPQTFGELIDGLLNGSIALQTEPTPGFNMSNEYERIMSLYYDVVHDNLARDTPLEPDYRTQKPIRHNINWIATDLT